MSVTQEIIKLHITVERGTKEEKLAEQKYEFAFNVAYDDRATINTLNRELAVKSYEIAELLSARLRALYRIGLPEEIDK